MNGGESQHDLCMELISDCSRVLRMPIREKRRRSWMVPSWKDGRSIPRCRLQHTCWSHQCTLQINVCPHFISSFFDLNLALLVDDECDCAVIAGTDTTLSYQREGRTDRSLCSATLMEVATVTYKKTQPLLFWPKWFYKLLKNLLCRFE